MKNSLNLKELHLGDWAAMAQFADEYFLVPGSYLDKVNSRKYPKDAFSLGQLTSKGWLLQVLKNLNVNDTPVTVAQLGCWVGSIVDPLHRNFNIERIYGFDVDAESIALAEEFNAKWYYWDWKFKGVVADITMMPLNDMVFQTEGELIEVKPNWIINTSCEHMSTEWFECIDNDQLVILQTNDSEKYEGHINTCQTLDEVDRKYPMSKVLFSGYMVTPLYTRFMKIGYK